MSGTLSPPFYLIHAKQNPGEVPPGFFAFLGLFYCYLYRFIGRVVDKEINLCMYYGWVCASRPRVFNADIGLVIVILCQHWPLFLVTCPHSPEQLTIDTHINAAAILALLVKSGADQLNGPSGQIVITLLEVGDALIDLFVVVPGQSDSAISLE